MLQQDYEKAERNSLQSTRRSSLIARRVHAAIALILRRLDRVMSLII